MESVPNHAPAVHASSGAYSSTFSMTLSLRIVVKALLTSIPTSTAESHLCAIWAEMALCSLPVPSFCKPYCFSPTATLKTS